MTENETPLCAINEQHYTNVETNAKNSSGGLSGGAIAALVISSVVVVAVSVALVMWAMNHSKEVIEPTLYPQENINSQNYVGTSHSKADLGNYV